MINQRCVYEYYTFNRWTELDSDVTVVLGELQKVETQQVQLRWVGHDLDILGFFPQNVTIGACPYLFVLKHLGILIVQITDSNKAKYFSNIRGHENHLRGNESLELHLTLGVWPWGR